MSFWDVFDDNMVLQMEPAAAAVYGVVTPRYRHAASTPRAGRTLAVYWPRAPTMC